MCLSVESACFLLLVAVLHAGMAPKKGLASLNDLSISEKYQELGSQITNEKRDQLLTQLQVFQSALISFKSEYSKEIIQNPEIRNSFAEICIAFGIDPLVVASSIFDDPNNKDAKFKDHERINQLCMKLIEICNSTKLINGGIISVNEILQLINSDTWVNTDLHFKFTQSDIFDALDHLSVLGNELKLFKIGKKSYIKNTPQELNIDEKTILETAETLGFVSISILRDNFGWKKIRCQSAINDLVTNGILWIDSQGENGEIRYWITSWINNV